MMEIVTRSGSLKMDKQKMKSNEKAEVILKAAMEEFLSNGYAATSMNSIASTAGVSKATLYSYFQDKEGLFIALFNELVKKRFNDVLTPKLLETSNDDPKIVLKSLMQELYLTISSNRNLLDFLRLMIGESGRFPELARIHIIELVQPTVDLLSNYLNHQTQLVIRDSEATARIIIGSLGNFIILQEILGGNDVMPFDYERMIDTLVNLIDCQQKK
ncbi:TetR/AcrR family transcriptional regulator [Geminocystis sp.]|uniref:TetR/AcrR family transcriptional regulator n=1 Tax=Geminocystis sp. TaxID=2664100 RepID=UPI0035935ED8